MLTLASLHLAAQDKGPQTGASAGGRTVKSVGYDLEVEDNALDRQGKRVPATLANVVEALRDRYPHANIVLSPGLANLTVSDLKLRSSNLGEELEAVRVACAMQFELQGPRPKEPSIDPATGVPVAAPGIDPTTGIPVGAAGSANEGLFVLRRSGPPPQIERVVEAFNIGPYLDWLAASMEGENAADRREAARDKSVKQIAEIIDETISTFMPPPNPGGPPTLQFHPGANLLVVVGSRDSVEVARKIVNALPGMPATQPVEFSGRTGGPQPGMSEALMRRYGLVPHNSFPGGVAAPPPGGDDAMRKRYGLGPAAGQPLTPANPPPETNPSR
jgi:hypothetical protein